MGSVPKILKKYRLGGWQASVGLNFGPYEYILSIYEGGGTLLAAGVWSLPHVVSALVMSTVGWVFMRRLIACQGRTDE